MKCMFSRKTFQPPDLCDNIQSDVRCKVESDFHSPTTQRTISYLKSIYIYIYIYIHIHILASLTINAFIRFVHKNETLVHTEGYFSNHLL
jgi:hypothetical protein